MEGVIVGIVVVRLVVAAFMMFSKNPREKRAIVLVWENGEDEQELGGMVRMRLGRSFVISCEHVGTREPHLSDSARQHPIVRVRATRTTGTRMFVAFSDYSVGSITALQLPFERKTTKYQLYVECDSHGCRVVKELGTFRWLREDTQEVSRDLAELIRGAIMTFQSNRQAA